MRESPPRHPRSLPGREHGQKLILQQKRLKMKQVVGEIGFAGEVGRGGRDDACRKRLLVILLGCEVDFGSGDCGMGPRGAEMP